jgi:hypothetical protein
VLTPFNIHLVGLETITFQTLKFPCAVMIVRTVFEKLTRPIRAGRVNAPALISAYMMRGDCRKTQERTILLFSGQIETLFFKVDFSVTFLAFATTNER